MAHLGAYKSQLVVTIGQYIYIYIYLIFQFLLSGLIGVFFCTSDAFHINNSIRCFWASVCVCVCLCVRRCVGVSYICPRYRIHMFSFFCLIYALLCLLCLINAYQCLIYAWQTFYICSTYAWHMLEICVTDLSHTFDILICIFFFSYV